MQRSGVKVLSSADGTLAIELPAENQQRLVFSAAQDAGARVRGLYPKRSSLEEMFMSAINRQRQQGRDAVTSKEPERGEQTG